MNLDQLLLRDFTPVPAVRRELSAAPRASTPAIDMHNHLGRWLGGGDWLVPDVAGLLDLMDQVNVRTIVNLDGRWDAELDANIARLDLAHPGRFLTFAHLDWSLLRGPDPTGKLIAALGRARDAGAHGIKIWKDLGLSVTDAGGARVLPDDPRLTDVFAAAGHLGMPILIHTADPIAFFAPLDATNERLEELAQHPDWWFGGPEHPTFDRLMAALETVVARAPGTTFIGAHVGCAAEDLGWVDGMLTRYPNFHIDLGGRLAELGRRPRATRRLILAHPDRVLWGSDAFPPTREAYEVHWRFLQTEDECFAYAPGAAVPPQGRWDISAVGLPADVLTRVYAGNARRVFALDGPPNVPITPGNV